MLHPIGSEPPSVYWRRRLALLASGIVILGLIVVTVRTVVGGGGSAAIAAGSASRSTGPGGSSSHGSASAAPSRSVSGTSGAGSSGASPSGTGATGSTTGSTAPAPSGHSASGSGTEVSAAGCTASQLDIAATTEHSVYHVGDQPTLSVTVTDTGSVPCVQDLADRQIVLRVYNGESRVWGSHDCMIEPGVTDRTLMPHEPVIVSVQWSGLSSQPGCAGVRQRVGAGSYTLYASVSGHQGRAAQFSIR